MELKLKLNYYNASLNIGMASIQKVYLLSPILTPLQAAVYRGKRVYRLKGFSQRISYDQLKHGLIKKDFTVLGGNEFIIGFIEYTKFQIQNS